MQSIEALIKQLGTEAGPKAAAGLVALGKSAVQPLMSALADDSSPDVRAAAAWALGELADKVAEATLEKALDDEDQDVRWFSQGALAKMRGQTQPPAKGTERFRPLALDRSMSGMKSVSQRKKKSAEPAEAREAEPVPQHLLDALKNDDQIARWEALRGIFEVAPDHEAVQAGLKEMTDALGSRDGRTRSWAAVTLGMLGHKALQTLTEVMQSEDPTQRMYAAWSLGLTNEPDAVYPLLDAVKDARPEVRAASAVALGELGDARSVNRLMAALSDPHWLVRETAAAALGETGEPRAVPSLKESLDDEDERVRKAAIDALAKLGAEDKKSRPSRLSNAA